MAEYQVINLDVWGNENDGYEVNDMYATSIYVNIPDIDNDADIIVELIDAGILKPHATTDNIDIDGDDYCLYIEESATGFPLYHLRLKDQRQ